MRNVEDIFQIQATVREVMSYSIGNGITYEYYTKLLGLDETYHIICISAEMELNERY